MICPYHWYDKMSWYIGLLVGLLTTSPLLIHCKPLGDSRSSGLYRLPNYPGHFLFTPNLLSNYLPHYSSGNYTREADENNSRMRMVAQSFLLDFDSHFRDQLIISIRTSDSTSTVIDTLRTSSIPFPWGSWWPIGLVQACGSQTQCWSICRQTHSTRSGFPIRVRLVYGWSRHKHKVSCTKVSIIIKAQNYLEAQISYKIVHRLASCSCGFSDDWAPFARASENPVLGSSPQRTQNSRPANFGPNRSLSRAWTWTFTLTLETSPK